MSTINTAENKITNLYVAPVDTTNVPSLSAIIEPESELKLPNKTTETDKKPATLRKDKELEQKLHEATEILQTHFDVNNKKLDFSVHDDSGRMIVKIIDPDSGEILKELPSEAVLKMADDIKQFQEDIFSSTGLLLDEMV
ncbi:flagellar protein FlaG [Moritella sp.]|uniref:flagellar protein FlaG n=1 Tax=Moritella sp. TaxID=78556 RepID=UPI001D2FF5DD|nr:flagellar protein FlaG [Moritella sp.]MCJ8348343.1 flagellar protein FlaG [Moritella sp.]NQZ38863.1 flagellar protein FlaG [Moritella sp.]